MLSGLTSKEFYHVSSLFPDSDNSSSHLCAAGRYAGLPVMLFRSDRARFYSYLHRIWNKTSTKPVWLKMSERGERIFY